MKVYILRHTGHVASILGVFDTSDNAIKFAKHFKYDEYVIEEHIVETLKGWK